MSQEKNGENTDLKCGLTLYCTETWTLRKEDITRLEAFEMWIWRRMEKISWMEHISNEEVLKLVEERSMLTITITRQRNWMGYIMRGDSLQREIIEGIMEGKRGRGRPRQKLLQNKCYKSSVPSGQWFPGSVPWLKKGWEALF